jgi:CTP:molybdopterin cytidylyltransferase MocA
VWPLLPVTGDDGARTVMREHPELVHEVSCSGTAADIDTLEDVQRWKSS